MDHSYENYTSLVRGLFLIIRILEHRRITAMRNLHLLVNGVSMYQTEGGIGLPGSNITLNSVHNDLVKIFEL